MFFDENSDLKGLEFLGEIIKYTIAQDILITCTDNLNGFTETIRTVFPNSATQICVVHQIRNSCKYMVYKDKKEFTADI